MIISYKENTECNLMRNGTMMGDASCKACRYFRAAHKKGEVETCTPERKMLFGLFPISTGRYIQTLFEMDAITCNSTKWLEWLGKSHKREWNEGMADSAWEMLRTGKLYETFGLSAKDFVLGGPCLFRIDSEMPEGTIVAKDFVEFRKSFMHFFDIISNRDFK